MKEALQFVKNTKTGVVFALTRVLKKMRTDLIPCTKEGIPMAYNHNADMPMLFNPYTDNLLPNTGDNSRIAGLIPCRDEEHAQQIKAALMGQVPETKAEAPDEQVGLQEPPTKPAETTNVAPALATAPANAVDTNFIEMLRITNVEGMNKDALKAFATEHFGEKLNGRLAEDVLREQVQVMINAKLSEAA